MPCDNKLVKIIGVAACLLLGGCSGLDLLNAVVPSGGYRVAADQAFGSASAQKLDVLIPKDVIAGERRPVVLFFYGGSWKEGSRAQYRFVGEALTSKGFIAVIADYRHFPDVKFPAFQTDAALALRWTVDHIAKYNGNPDAIFVMGHSAGAHMGALLTVDPTYARAAGVNDGTIKGFIGLAGPYAMVPSQVNSIRDVFSGLSDENVARPVHFVTVAGPKPPPMLLLYGLDDKTVGRANAPEFAARVKSAGGEAAIIEYSDITHPGIVLALARYFRGRAPVLEDAAAFVDRIALKH